MVTKEVAIECKEYFQKNVKEVIKDIHETDPEDWTKEELIEVLKTASDLLEVETDLFIKLIDVYIEKCV